MIASLPHWSGLILMVWLFAGIPTGLFVLALFQRTARSDEGGQ